MIDILDLVNALTLAAVEDGWQAGVAITEAVRSDFTVTMRTEHGTWVADIPVTPRKDNT